MAVSIKMYTKERGKEITDQLRNGMNNAVLIVENQAKVNVSKTGDEHPQVRTGRLRSSITSKVTETMGNIIGEVGTNVVYGKYLEFGAANRPPYAWLFPAIEEKKSEIKNALKGRSFGVY